MFWGIPSQRHFHEMYFNQMMFFLLKGRFNHLKKKDKSSLTHLKISNWLVSCPLVSFIYLFIFLSMVLFSLAFIFLCQAVRTLCTGSLLNQMSAFITSSSGNATALTSVLHYKARWGGRCSRYLISHCCKLRN